MTLYHFGNCLALVYVPYYLTYKHSGLCLSYIRFNGKGRTEGPVEFGFFWSEYGAFWKCIQAGMSYMVTQLAKMMILATFFPTSEGPEGIVGEIFKYSVDIADLVGLYLILSSIPGKGHAKVLTAGIGWAGAEILLTRCVLLWIGARGEEFDWKYIHKCFESNISMVQHIATATLVWLWSRHDLHASLQPLVVALMIIGVYKPLILDTLITAIGVGPWVALGLKAIATLVVGVTTLQIYAGVAHAIGVF